jgi:hypothetical protein
MIEAKVKQMRIDAMRSTESQFQLDPIILKAMTDKLKKRKAPALDGLLNEMIKYGGPKLQIALLSLFKLFKALRVIPSYWKTIPYTPAFKKGNHHEAKNYRPLGNISILFKLYEKLVDYSIRAIIRLSEDQMGFRPIFSTHTLLLRVEMAMKISKAAGTNLHIAGIDYQEAFDRTWRPGILYRLWEQGIRSDIWLIIDDMLTRTISYVKTNFGNTLPFHTLVGVIQGSVLAAVLFTLHITPLAAALANTSEDFGITRLPPQMFADDVTLLATRIAKFRQATHRTHTGMVEKVGLGGKHGQVHGNDCSHGTRTRPATNICIPPNKQPDTTWGCNRTKWRNEPHSTRHSGSHATSGQD